MHGQNSNDEDSNPTNDFSENTTSSGNTMNPEMMQNLMKMFMSSSNNHENNQSQNTNQSNPSIDMNTILKMKSIMDKMRNL